MEEHFFSNMNAATDHFAETEILKQQVWDIVLMLVVLGTEWCGCKTSVFKSVPKSLRS